jgi:FlaA1/EpsC-like NDP-sugar epimerase
MVKRFSRWLIPLYVASDAILAAVAFVLAYLLRFETGLIPVTKGLPPFRQYVNILPFVATLVPFAYYLQGLYRAGRGRSRVDDFFAVLVGSVLAVVLGVVSTLYVQTYVVSETLRAPAGTVTW